MEHGRRALAMAAAIGWLIGCPSGNEDDDTAGQPPGDDDVADDDVADDDVADDDVADDDVADDDAADDDAADDDAAGQDVPLDGFGEITGDCGVLDDEEWDSPSPFLFRNAVDFGSLEYDDSLLSAGAQEIIADGNLGGSSIYSEAIAFDMLYRCELADLLKTETEIIYLDDGGKKTDILVELDALDVGVSVTRAYHWPPEDPYTVEEALELLDGKLADVLLSAANADPADAWVRSILHVVAYDAAYADSVETAFAQVDDDTKADTIVVVTVSDGEDEFLY